METEEKDPNQNNEMNDEEIPKESEIEIDYAPVNQEGNTQLHNSLYIA